MSVLSDPLVTLDGVMLEKISLSAVDLAVTIRVENKNPLGATLESCPFSVSYDYAGKHEVIASGETGSAKIPGNSVTVVPARVTSKNAALLGADCRACPWREDRCHHRRDGQNKIFDDPKTGPLYPDRAGNRGRDRRDGDRAEKAGLTYKPAREIAMGGRGVIPLPPPHVSGHVGVPTPSFR